LDRLRGKTGQHSTGANLHELAHPTLQKFRNPICKCDRVDQLLAEQLAGIFGGIRVGLRRRIRNDRGRAGRKLRGLQGFRERSRRACHQWRMERRRD
jgi:hypothetical protein